MIFAIAWTMEVWGSKGLPVNMGVAVRTSEQTTARKMQKAFFFNGKNYKGSKYFQENFMLAKPSLVYINCMNCKCMDS